MRVTVVGGGIAGVSVACALATHRSGAAVEVTLVEAEATLAAHTTGRSAAQYIANYGSGPTRALTAASARYFESAPLLSPRPVLTVAPASQDAELSETLTEGASAGVVEVDMAEAARLFPPLRRGWATRALLEKHSADIDVGATHQRFVTGLRGAGGRITVGDPVEAVRPDGAGWAVRTLTGVHQADLVVNAAGAWGDVVAERAAVAPIGLQPLRRTAFMVACDRAGAAGWPLVVDAAHSWYCKPDGVQLLCSPADEAPSEPCDARPEEVDVARAIDRINAATTMAIRSVRSAWAGLRTFAPDRSLVLGPDPAHPGFVWCVGQGGVGIQTAPAAGALVADLVLEGRPGPLFDDVDLDLAGLRPDRLR